MNGATPQTLKVDLHHPGTGAWQVVIETEGERRRLADLAALIRYLQQLAAQPDPAPRGLR